MEEEMQGAEEYIKCAMRYKDEDVMLAKMYSDMSADELKHALALHDAAVRLINEYKQKGEVVPPEMKAVYDYLHEKHMDRFNAIKLQQATFRA